MVRKHVYVYIERWGLQILVLESLYDFLSGLRKSSNHDAGATPLILGGISSTRNTLPVPKPSI